MFMHKCVHNANQTALLVNRAVSAVSGCVWAVRRSHVVESFDDYLITR